jgi:competence protein ComEA
VEEELHAVVERLRALGSERRWTVVLLACLAVAAGGAWLHASAHAGVSPPGGSVPRARPSESIAVSAPAAEVVIDVVGAVRHPGLQHMASGTRIADAITAAGGAQSNADVEQLNLAARLVDGERIVVPRHGEIAPASSDPRTNGASNAPVDLNTATADQLDALPGVGPATADAIIRDRDAHGPFHSVDDLARVRGIGPAKLDQLRDLVTV